MPFSGHLLNVINVFQLNKTSLSNVNPEKGNMGPFSATQPVLESESDLKPALEAEQTI